MAPGIEKKSHRREWSPRRRPFERFCHARSNSTRSKNHLVGEIESSIWLSGDTSSRKIQEPWQSGKKELRRSPYTPNENTMNRRTLAFAMAIFFLCLTSRSEAGLFKRLRAKRCGRNACSQPATCVQTSTCNPCSTAVSSASNSASCVPAAPCCGQPSLELYGATGPELYNTAGLDRCSGRVRCLQGPELPENSPRFLCVAQYSCDVACCGIRHRDNPSTLRSCLDAARIRFAYCTGDVDLMPSSPQSGCIYGVPNCGCDAEDDDCFYRCYECCTYGNNCDTP